MQTNEFGFGIEAEFLLVDNQSYKPLSYRTLDFQTLLELVDSIPTADCSRNGFNKKPLHNLISPYLIEGYTLTDPEMKPSRLLPKGIEIRTPLTDSFEKSTELLNDLYKRLKTKLIECKFNAAMISYHPTEQKIDAPANYKRYDYWQWALTATTTYGPDINISLPKRLEEKVNIERINARVNYYAPAAIALTLASPIRDGALWTVNDQTGKSVRTFERSRWAPIFYVHEKPSLRFEFKGFEMSTNLSDYHAMFLIGLALLLDESLTKQQSDENRISELESIAIHGLESESVQEKAAQVLKSAHAIADKFALDAGSLKTFWQRLTSKELPADDITTTFRQTGSIEETLRTLTDFNSHCQSGNNSNKTACLV